MLLKAKVRFERVNPKTGRPQKTTVEMCGRTEEELNRRIEKLIYVKTVKNNWRIKKKCLTYNR